MRELPLGGKVARWLPKAKRKFVLRRISRQKLAFLAKAPTLRWCDLPGWEPTSDGLGSLHPNPG